MDGPELERIRQVYAGYRHHGKWRNPNPGREWMRKEGNENFRRFLNEKLEPPLSQCRILDIGCGGGRLLGWFHEQGAQASNLFGVDLLSDRISMARRNYPAFNFYEANAEKLNFPDNHFDIVSAITVFSSILDAQTSANIAQTIMRVLKMNGIIAWYDLRYPSPWNANVRAMTKARIRQLFPDFSLNLIPTTLLPPIAENLGHYTDTIYPILGKVPFLRSHYIGIISRN